MIYHIALSNSARRALKKFGRSGTFKASILEEILCHLEHNESLPIKFKDHGLHGRLSKFRECHIGFDLLLLYERDDEEKVIIIADIGTHQELFGG